jgi:hypothetical protein
VGGPGRADPRTRVFSLSKRAEASGSLADPGASPIGEPEPGKSLQENALGMIEARQEKPSSQPAVDKDLVDGVRHSEGHTLETIHHGIHGNEGPGHDKVTRISVPHHSPTAKNRGEAR